MKFTVIIPARFASQRLPGKPLMDIHGKTMIERVYEQAKLSKAARVIVATDHPDIEAVVRSFGGEVCMTSESHESGTDRLAEVANIFALADDDLVVNVQGDEPLIPPAVINQVAENLFNNTSASVSTVSEPIASLEMYLNPNAVKVVSDNTGMALYFSRASIPWNRDLLADAENNQQAIEAFLNDDAPVQKHIGIYGYRVSLLREFITWPMAKMESIEKLEQLRVMENGHRIHVEPAIEAVPGGIDTAADLELVRELMSNTNKG